MRSSTTPFPTWITTESRRNTSLGGKRHPAAFLQGRGRALMVTQPHFLLALLVHTLSMSSLNIYAPGILCRKRKWLPCGASLKSWRQGTEPAWEMSGGCGRTTPVQAAHQRLRGQQMWKGGREGRLQQPLSIFFYQLKTSSLLWLKRTANKPACTEGTSTVH